MDRLLRAVLKPAPRETETAGSETDHGCPDAGVLAAFVEGGLTANEQSALDAHMADCSHCREALAILSHELPAQDEETVAPAETAWFTWATRPRLRWLVPISAAATVAVVFFATRPLIAPESEETLPSEIVRMAQAPSTPTRVPADEPEALREKSGAVPEKREDISEVRRDEAAKLLVAQAPAPKDTREELADAAPAPSPAQMAAAAPPGGQVTVAPQAANVAGAADAVRTEAAAGTGRAAGGAGAPTKRMRSLEANALTVSAPGGTVQWRLGAGGRLSRSVDAGASWQAQASGVTTDLLAGEAPSPSVCWIAGAAGTVLVTSDGQRWERRPFPEPVDLVAVTVSGSRTATVSTRDGRRFDTLDGGLTWSPKQ
jgi:hypothetical protein